MNPSSTVWQIPPAETDGCIQSLVQIQKLKETIPMTYPPPIHAEIGCFEEWRLAFTPQPPTCYRTS
jgi:hypothetical protein